MTSPNVNFPLTVTSVNFFTDPFDQWATEFWTDISTRNQSLDSSVGRQYELDQNQAGEATLTLYDPDEALNPANTSSPYYPNVKIYRRITDQAMWPNQSTGNLLNTGYGNDPRLLTTNGYDTSFNSYTAGSTVPWITVFGGASTPTVVAGSGVGGTNALSYNVSNTFSPTNQGVRVNVPCIPNRQYTTSVYVSQNAGNTTEVAIGGNNSALNVNSTIIVSPILGGSDNFSRTVSSGWGTADVGGSWTSTGGSAADYSVSSGFGVHSLNAVNTPHFSLLGTGSREADQTVIVTVPVVATGAAYSTSLVARFQNTSNYYIAGLQWNTNSSLTAFVSKVVAGVSTTIQSVLIPSVVYTAGTSYKMRFAVASTSLALKIWVAGTSEPSTWTISTTDTSLGTTGSIGVMSTLATGNTNTLPVAISWDIYRAGTALVGSSTSATGFVRLSVTFTANSPTHSFKVYTTGAVTSGTVLVDQIQHEQGAVANTFTTSGPTIYGIFTGYVERWPSSWNYQGTYGMAQITCVDAFAPMAGQNLWTEYRNAVQALSPAFYWPLSDASGSTQYAEVSGNGGPAFRATPSIFGGGNGLTSQALNIPGDPSGNGVKFSTDTGATAPDYIDQKVTYLNISNDTYLNRILAPLNWANYTIQPYSYTASWWENSTGNTSIANLSTSTHFQSAPVWLLTNSIGPPANTQLSSFSASLIYNFDIANSKLHHIAVTVSGTGGVETLTLWIDGTNVASATAATPTFQGPWNNNIYLGAYPTLGGVSPLTLNGTMGHIALWNRALASNEIIGLYNAGTTGYSGENSGTRVQRYLGYQFIASSSAETGNSTMGISSLTSNTSLLDACQNVTTTENGNIFCDGNGIIQFQARQHRYQETSAIWVFGENQAGGEIPYLGGLVFDYDPTQVYNDVTITNSSGITTSGGDLVSIATSRNRYGKRSYSRSINTLSNNEAQDAANWIFYAHDDATQRIEQVTVDIAANPAILSKALAIKISDRSTVNRRTSVFTMANDYFIERIEHSRGPGKWQMIFQMSPVLGRQPWILGDSVYGVLGSTTILGY